MQFQAIAPIGTKLVNGFMPGAENTSSHFGHLIEPPLVGWKLTCLATLQV